jgi:hypothetical protein
MAHLDASKIAYQLPPPIGMLADIFVPTTLDLD